MKFLLPLFLAGLLGATNSQVHEGCIDPPGNGEIADLVVMAIEAARPLLETGIPSLGIPPIDPFGPIPPVNFHIDVSGLRMDGTVSETQVRNLAQFFICSLNISVGISQKFAVEFRLDNFHMDGMYDVDGLIAGLFPVFGDGGFTLDTYDTGFSGGAKVSYNVFTDHITLKDLTFDVFFKDLKMEMECINGCGDMSDLINGVVSQIGPAIFEAVWNAIEPPLASLIQDGINYILKNISISDVINPDQLDKLHPMDLGNANDFVDSIMGAVNNAIVVADLDPALLPETSLNLGVGEAVLYEGQVEGLSKMYRGGTCTLDKVASWVFLYANLADENLQVHYQANVTSGSTTSVATIGASVKIVEAYLVARKDTFGLTTDIDQFVVTEFGRIDVDIDGLGLLGFMLEPLTEGVMNLVRDEITNILETEVKDLLQDILGETPWPAL
uniref:Juvenile hormone binding protein 5 n=1 Tax=Scylla paramamosain TaxID=85552 RepID=A0A856NS62_SCYPA|nr:juvenile hormone binding protein 5 [Scylla paramamosain]